MLESLTKSLNMKTKINKYTKSKFSFFDKESQYLTLLPLCEKKKEKKKSKRIQSFSHCSLEEDVLLFISSLDDVPEPPAPPSAVVPNTPGTAV